MKNQTISRDNLKEIYNIACPSWKTKIEGYAKRNPFDNEISFTQSELDEMFKASDEKQINVLKRFFSTPKDIRDRVKSFLDACNVLDLNPKEVYHASDTPDEVAFKKLKVIIKALNEGWYPNWNNESESKWINHFKMTGGFSSYGTYFSNTFTFVPSALCLKTEELAKHVFEIALNEYKEYYSNGVSITLTPEQLAEVAHQTNQIKSYTDITSFEKACERLGVEVFQFNSNVLTKSEIALRKLKFIVKAIRSFTNWKPVWSNTNQYKYTVWFDLEEGFSSYDASYSTRTTVPSALYVESQEQAKFLRNTFLDLYKDYILED